MHLSQSDHSIVLRRWHKRPVQVKNRPQTDCSRFNDSSALEDSLFFNPCTVSPVVQNITHFDHMIRVIANIHWELNSGLFNVSYSYQERQILTAFINEQFVRKRTKYPKRGSAGKVSHWASILKRKEGRDHFCHLFFCSFHNLRLPTGKPPFLHFNSWDWRVISHADQEEHFRLLNVTLRGTEQPHHSSASSSDWLCSPLP